MENGSASRDLSVEECLGAFSKRGLVPADIEYQSRPLSLGPEHNASLGYKELHLGPVLHEPLVPSVQNWLFQRSEWQ